MKKNDKYMLIEEHLKPGLEPEKKPVNLHNQICKNPPQNPSGEKRRIQNEGTVRESRSPCCDVRYYARFVGPRCWRPLGLWRHRSLSQ